MASLADIHFALAGRLSTIDGLRVAPYPPGEELAPPRAHVQLSTVMSRTMSRTSVKEYTFRVFVFVANTVRPQDGYNRLLDYADPVSPLSIGMAIWDGNVGDTFVGTFDGVTYTCAKTRATVVADEWFTELGAADVNAYQMHGGVFVVQVGTQETP